MAERRAVLAVFQVAIIVASVASVGMAAGAMTTTTADAGETGTPLHSQAPESGSSGEQTADVQAQMTANQSRTVIVHLEQADIPANTPPAEAERRLKEHASNTQSEVAGFTSSNSGFTIKQRLWLTNVLVVEVAPGADLSRLASVGPVTGIEENFEVSIPTSPDSTETLSTTDTSTSQSSFDASYGPEQINATDVWGEHNTMGEGATVAVLDTGVDGDHPAITGSLEKFAEFDEDGDIVQSGVENAHDTNGHGTHTSGLVVGNDSNGEYLGSAPKADLYHGLVLSDGYGSFAQIIGGMQWAVENDADVISMSLGSGGYDDGFITPIRNAEAAGTVVVVAAGNSGPGSSSSPGNIYESLSVGANDANREIASFSSNETIYKSNFDNPPANWPTSYQVPDVTAPGVQVLSAAPDDDYARISGTSMSTPLVAGSVALLESAATNNPSVDLLKSSLKETAVLPTGADANRFGNGIIDVKAAADRVTTDTNASARLTDGMADSATPNETITARFRVSNVDAVNVSFQDPPNASVDASNVTVWVNGTATDLGTTHNLASTASNDHFTVSIAVNDSWETPAFNMTFMNTSADSTDSHFHSLVVHPDPVMVDNTTNESVIGQRLTFAADDTTFKFEGGTYEFNQTLDIKKNHHLMPQAGDDVEFDVDHSTGVLFWDDVTNASMTDIVVRGNSSLNQQTGVLVHGDNVTLDQVSVFTTTHGIVAKFSDHLTVRDGSLPMAAASENVNATGIALVNTRKAHIVSTDISAEDKYAVGITVQYSWGTVIEESSVITDAQDGILAEADAVEFIGGGNTMVRNSDFESEAGSAIRTLGTENTTVMSTPLTGSNVSAGLTGTLFLEATGEWVSESTLSTLVDATTSTQQIDAAGETVTIHNIEHLSASEYRALAAMTNHTAAENVSEHLSGVDLETVQSMNTSERIAYANETLENVSRTEVEAVVSATADVGTNTHDSFVLMDSTVTGEYAPVAAVDADLMMSNVTVRNSSYSKIGVYAAGSNVYVKDSSIDPTTGDVSYETGVYNLGSAVYLENTRVTATYGVVNFFGSSYAENSTLKGEAGMVGFGFSSAYKSQFKTTKYGIADLYAYAFTNDFDSRVGIFAESMYAQYNNFADTQVAFDAYYGYAPLNWYGSERGPTTAFEDTSGVSIEGWVEYDPFLTEPPSQLSGDSETIQTLDHEESDGAGTQAFATDLVMEPGQAYAFAVPGPTAGNLSQMFNSFNGVIYGFDAESQSWYQITPGNDHTLDALDALLVVPDTTARAVVEFENSQDNTKVPAARDMHEGWNFVGAPQYGDVDDAFAASSADPARVVNVYDGPDSQLEYSYDGWTVYTMGSDEDWPPHVSAFKGYFVYAEENGTVAANVPEGVTYEELQDAIKAWGDGSGGELT